MTFCGGIRAENSSNNYFDWVDEIFDGVNG
jgi:hypothetical protein